MLGAVEMAHLDTLQVLLEARRRVLQSPFFETESGHMMCGVPQVQENMTCGCTQKKQEGLKGVYKNMDGIASMSVGARYDVWRHQIQEEEVTRLQAWELRGIRVSLG